MNSPSYLPLSTLHEKRNDHVSRRFSMCKFCTYCRGRKNVSGDLRASVFGRISPPFMSLSRACRGKGSGVVRVCVPDRHKSCVIPTTIVSGGGISSLFIRDPSASHEPSLGMTNGESVGMTKVSIVDCLIFSSFFLIL